MFFSLAIPISTIAVAIAIDASCINTFRHITGSWLRIPKLLWHLIAKIFIFIDLIAKLNNFFNMFFNVLSFAYCILNIYKCILYLVGN